MAFSFDRDRCTEERHIATQQALEDYEKLAEQYIHASEERQQLGLDAQWGTITPSGWLTFDPNLLRLPKDLGEYVIVHELVHLLAPNHGRIFKLFLCAYLPDWEEREKRLQEYV